MNSLLHTKGQRTIIVNSTQNAQRNGSSLISGFSEQYSHSRTNRFKHTLKAAFALNDLHGGNDGCMAEIENLMSGWGQPSRTTLYGILHLLTGCRAVWEYRLTSRRRLYPFIEDHVNKRTTYLNIGDSYFVSDARARFAHNSMFAQPQHIWQTSAVLVKMFPELNGIGGAWCPFRK